MSRGTVGRKRGLKRILRLSWVKAVWWLILVFRNRSPQVWGRAGTFHPQRLARTSSDESCLKPLGFNKARSCKPVVPNRRCIAPFFSVCVCFSLQLLLVSQLAPEKALTLPTQHKKVISPVFTWIYFIIAMVIQRDPQVLTSKDCLSYCFCQITDCKDILPGKCPAKHLCGIIGYRNKAHSRCIKASQHNHESPLPWFVQKCKQLLTPEYFKNGLFFLLLTPWSEYS